MASQLVIFVFYKEKQTFWLELFTNYQFSASARLRFGFLVLMVTLFMYFFVSLFGIGEAASFTNAEKFSTSIVRDDKNSFRELRDTTTGENASYLAQHVDADGTVTRGNASEPHAAAGDKLTCTVIVSAKPQHHQRAETEGALEVYESELEEYTQVGYKTELKEEARAKLQWELVMKKFIDVVLDCMDRLQKRCGTSSVEKYDVTFDDKERYKLSRRWNHKRFLSKWDNSSYPGRPSKNWHIINGPERPHRKSGRSYDWGWFDYVAYKLRGARHDGHCTINAHW